MDCIDTPRCENEKFEMKPFAMDKCLRRSIIIGCKRKQFVKSIHFLPVLLIYLRLLDALVLGSAILKPDFDLSLRQLQPIGQLASASPRNVLVSMELDLEPERLLAAERGALPPRPSFLPPSSRH